jgi:hypothetical protein
MKVETITVESHELEGLVEHLDVQLGCSGEGFEHATDRRAYLAYLTELMDIDDALSRAGEEAVELTRSEVLEKLIREGAAAAPDRLGDALRGLYGDQAATIRQAKGLMSLGARVGLYEGVMV